MCTPENVRRAEDWPPYQRPRFDEANPPVCMFHPFYVPQTSKSAACLPRVQVGAGSCGVPDWAGQTREALAEVPCSENPEAAPIGKSACLARRPRPGQATQQVCPAIAGWTANQIEIQQPSRS
jgi:hypothetical protein